MIRNSEDNGLKGWFLRTFESVHAVEYPQPATTTDEMIWISPCGGIFEGINDQ